MHERVTDAEKRALNAKRRLANRCHQSQKLMDIGPYLSDRAGPPRHAANVLSPSMDSIARAAAATILRLVSTYGCCLVDGGEHIDPGHD